MSDDSNFIAIDEKKRMVALQVIIMRQRDFFIAFSPALDLCAHGDTFEEAQQAFEEVLDIFLEDLIENDKVDSVLTAQGWDKVDHQWVPPTIVSHGSQTIQIPLCA